MVDTSSTTYSTTRSIISEPPALTVTPEQKFATVLRLPPGEDRQGEGGLRTQGKFKKPMNDRPLVSVITVVFNGHQHLERTITSVIEQTYDNVEYIIIDGGSTDGTLEIIKKYEDRIDYWVSEKDRGLYDAMNKAISLSSGTWLNFMNSADLYVDRDTLTQTMQYSTPEANVIYSDHFRYSDTSTELKRITCDAGRLYILHQSMLYRKTLHDLHGNYLVSKDVIISDYLFFNLLDRSAFTKSPHPISKNLVGGLSSDLTHVREKNAVDYLFNNIGLPRMVFLVVRERLGRLLLRFFKQ